MRKVWNETLAWRHHRWCGEGLSTNVPLTAMKRLPEFAYLNKVSSVSLQQVLRIQQKAFANFFAQRARYPRYKSRTGRQSGEYTRSAFRWRADFLHRASTRLVRDHDVVVVEDLAVKNMVRNRCPGCGTRHDRDENAAKNIRAAGLAVAPSWGDACGGDVSHPGSSRMRSPMKQELPAVRPRIPVLQGGE